MVWYSVWYSSSQLTINELQKDDTYTLKMSIVLSDNILTEWDITLQSSTYLCYVCLIPFIVNCIERHTILKT